MKPRSLVLPCALAICLLAAGCARPPEGPPVGEWRQFRGPDGLGISAETNLPVRWGAKSPNIRWRAVVDGAGNSSPIVSGGRIFLTTVYRQPGDRWARSKKGPDLQRVVLAYDLASGEKLWETAVYQGRGGRIHWTNTHATPTPVTDGELVFASFDGYLAALDHDGNVIWKREIDPAYLEHSHYGASSSPVLAGDAVILLQDGEVGENPDPGWIAAFDKATGDEIWRDEWTHTCCSYNTPLVVKRAGRLEVWNQSALEVNGYDARTGEKLWRGEHPSSQTVPSLVRLGDLFSTPGGMHTKSIEMFRLSETDASATPERLWTSRRYVPEISSPVLYRDRIFSVTKTGTLVVRDALTGEVVGRRRLPHGAYRPSLVAGDGKVYASNEEGLTVVIDADGDPPGVLSRNRLPGGSGASLAIADGSILLRARNLLYRIDKEPPPAARGGEDVAPAAAAGAEPAAT
jgi:outer membrane protein assembly factor BamB